ncbi:MAG: hypothetical protein GEV10_18025 [Streptosporangiales bacterium]|nr:hypothetical protein [Streptosporangiales bacterium]
MKVKEGSRVRLLVETTGIEGTVVPAGTVGTVVDDAHAPDEYAVDVKVDGQFDNVAVTGGQVEPV